ncbi:uncharacterized protein LOC121420492 [Lytechinus variegatus]|uniref:uncharacterized protein LOC121420492 n=1 Tax=Lytechinus variegatus TaxID=7654 RepID=UPI001BB1F51F|nr:uncharacterized protein LOC121420492 [Lytechinus variegatus]
MKRKPSRIRGVEGTRNSKLVFNIGLKKSPEVVAEKTIDAKPSLKPKMKKALQVELTLPGEGKDRMFNASKKFEGKVSLALLESALKGEVVNKPHDAVQALDVRMRHFSSLGRHRVPFMRARTWNQTYIWQKSPNWEHAIRG